MAFSSPIFLFLFLPVVLTVYPFARKLRLKNLWLLLVSILFYAWGEVACVSLMLASTLMNYALGLWVDNETKTARRKWAVGLAIGLNIGLLTFFKYANFLAENLNSLLTFLKLDAVHWNAVRLPIGISFFTFHALSYVIDIYRRKAKAAQSPAGVALYIFLFPQLIAGPILRWSAMAPQIARRLITIDGFVEGIRRFVYGLAKKMLIANVVAVPASKVFSMPARELSPELAWFGTLCYTLQIYYDFSGYSDMAVGLGKMFGFEFIENFNSPYIAESIKDFWRRWHISLSSWFRDYLYVPLGGNRCSKARTCANLLTVFFLCGLWHGASWTFVIWGLYHGIFLILERTRFGPFVASLSRPLRHIYTLVVVMVGWVLFRADTLPQAMTFLSLMFGVRQATELRQLLGMHLTNQVTCAILLGVLFSMPFRPWLGRLRGKLMAALPRGIRPGILCADLVFEPVLLMGLFILSAVWLAGGTYNPFIYFRF
jgi:alginate O-acetyltransferase complex protein AlgI